MDATEMGERDMLASAAHPLGASFDRLMAYESGELSYEDTLALFADLIRTGLAWQLQGHYGRAAYDLIRAGYVSRAGVVLIDPDGEG
jgi:hypothetical protein